LQADNLLADIPLKVKEASLVEDEKVTKHLYKDYSAFKNALWENLCDNNPDEDKLFLFKKTQKLLDRFLFIFFGEDKGLLPPNSISKIVEQWENQSEWGDDVRLYGRFVKYFELLNKGWKGKEYEIFAYNGGLFTPDELLDKVKIDDDVLHPYVMKLTAYDFESDVDVNILGHIFEHSLNEIETITAQLEGKEVDKGKTKRKKDGVFYTPKYITKYIVENTVGKLCTEKKEELDVVDEEYAKGRKNRKKETIKTLDKNLQAYRDWLLQITICDPACGSGAFLNQALEFLMQEHKYIDELESQLLGHSFEFPGVENHILENNLFGVDINEESVEIAKLSLWLRTAQKGRKLTSLNNNIKCGNSLIDDVEVAGDKAFNWQKEFTNVFVEKEKKAFHITWVTHNSRTSQRMIDNKVKVGDAFYLNDDFEVEITKAIVAIAEEDKLNVMAYNVCADHVHLLLVAEESEIPNIVRKLKGKSSQKLKEYLEIPKEEQFTLWAQKYNAKNIEDDTQLNNTIEYIQTNRVKHELHTNKGLQPLVEKSSMQQDYEQAFKEEYKGGFDVVIGNPPYLRVQGLRGNFEKESKHLENLYVSATGRFDIYVLFMEKSYQLIKQDGIVSFILPHKFLISDFGVGIRKYFIEKKAVNSIVNFGSEIVFNDASTYTCIINLERYNTEIKFKNIKPTQIFDLIEFDTTNYDNLTQENWNLKSEKILKLFDKIESNKFRVKDIFKNVSRGVVTGADGIFVLEGIIKGDTFFGYSKELDGEVEIESELMKPLLMGNSLSRYKNLENDLFLLYPHKLEDKTLVYGETELEKIFPKAYNYLLNFKELLVNKKIKYKTNPIHWFSLHNSRNKSLLESKKIITPYLSKKSQISIDLNGEYFMNDKCSFLILNDQHNISYEYYLALLNSNLLWFYIQNTSSEYSGGYFAYTNTYLEPFPLPDKKNNSDTKLVAEKVNLILSDTKKMQRVVYSFINYLQSQFSIEKLSKKLQNWHELEFADFIKELNKAIKKHNKEVSNKGLQPLVDTEGEKQPLVVVKENKPLIIVSLEKIESLTKLQEMEWMEVFETKKAEAQTLKAEIDKTDAEIDAMVYELYGLNEEEISIIENS